MARLTTRNFDNPVGQSFWIMRVIFTIAPILFGRADQDAVIGIAAGILDATQDLERGR